MSLALSPRAASSDLLQALKDPTPATRRWAVLELVQAPFGQADDQLAQAIHDDDREVRLAAISALAERRNMLGLRCLYRILTTADLAWRGDEEQRHLVAAYAKIGGRGAVTILDRLLHGPGVGEAAQTAAAVALAWIRTDAAQASLQLGLRHPVPGVRESCRKTWALLRSRRVRPRGPSLAPPLDGRRAPAQASPGPETPAPPARLPTNCLTALPTAPARLPTRCLAPLEEDTLQSAEPPVRRLPSTCLAPLVEDSEVTIQCERSRAPTRFERRS